MRPLSIYLALLGAIAWLVLSMGGLGGLMYIGLLAEGVTTPDDTWLRIPLWTLAACLMLIWWGGPAALILSGRTAFRWIGELSNQRPLATAEWITIAGHFFAAVAGANAILFPSIVDREYVYGFMLLGAACYGIGLLTVALTARSKRTPSGGDSPPLGAV